MANNNAVACINYGNIYYSNNYGQTWTLSTQPNNAISSWNSITISSNNNAIAVDNNTIYYSTNNGQTWTNSFTNVLNKSYRTSNLNVSLLGNTLPSWVIGFTSGVAVSNTNWVYHSFNYGNGGSATLYSTDYGRTWTACDIAGFNYYGGCSCSADGKHVFLSLHNGLRYSSNYGYGPFPLITSEEVSVVACSADARYVYYFTISPTVKFYYAANFNYSTSTGSFTQVTFPSPGLVGTYGYQMISCSEDGRYVYAAVTDNGATVSKLFISTTFGVSFINITNPVTAGSRLILNMKCNGDGRIVYMMTASTSTTIGVVWISTNYGNSWRRTNNTYFGNNATSFNSSYGSSGNDYNMVTCNSVGNRIFASIRGGNIIYSNDYGETWSVISNTKNWYRIGMNPKGTIVVAGVEINNAPQSFTYAIADTPFYNTSAPISDAYNPNTVCTSGIYYPNAASISDSGRYALVSSYNNNLYYSDTSGVYWSLYNNKENWTNIELSRDGTYALATTNNKIYASSIATQTSFPKPMVNYRFNIGDTNLNNQIANYASGSPVYDCSLYNSYIQDVDNFALNQYTVRPIDSVGELQTTITTLGTYTIVDGTAPGYLFTAVVSADQLRIIYSMYKNSVPLYFSRRTTITSSWSTPIAIPNPTPTPTNISRFTGIALTQDGNRGVACIGWDNLTGFVYLFIWNSSTSSYSTLTQTLDTTARDYKAIALTGDGSRMIACSVTNIFFASWNGSNYSTFTQTLNTVTPINYFHGVATTLNGDRIVYGSSSTTNNWFISFWNGTNYADGINFRTVSSGNVRMAYFSSDANILFLSYDGFNTNGGLEFGVYNKSIKTYDAFSFFPTSLVPSGSTWNMHGLCVADNGKYANVYIVPHGNIICVQ
jgi:photosystem II stability/assembly factor-like uncharacterized protein